MQQMQLFETAKPFDPVAAFGKKAKWCYEGMATVIEIGDEERARLDNGYWAIPDRPMDGGEVAVGSKVIFRVYVAAPRFFYYYYDNQNPDTADYAYSGMVVFV